MRARPCTAAVVDGAVPRGRVRPKSSRLRPPGRDPTGAQGGMSLSEPHPAERRARGVASYSYVYVGASETAAVPDSGGVRALYVLVPMAAVRTGANAN